MKFNSSTADSSYVLIVDDNEFDRTHLSSLLRQLGISDILEASSGEECLAQISRRKVSLVLLDSNMPGKSGRETLRIIRQSYSAIDLPVVMITGNSESTDVVNALQDGANDYITKPIDYDVTKARITTHLKLSQLSREMTLMKKMEAVQAMIITYNHEINTPLSIALISLEGATLTEKNVSKAKNALTRIASIVKSISDLADQNTLELEPYSETSKMVRLGLTANRER